MSSGLFRFFVFFLKYLRRCVRAPEKSINRHGRHPVKKNGFSMASTIARPQPVDRTGRSMGRISPVHTRRPPAMGRALRDSRKPLLLLRGIAPERFGRQGKGRAGKTGTAPALRQNISPRGMGRFLCVFAVGPGVLIPRRASGFLCRAYPLCGHTQLQPSIERPSLDWTPKHGPLPGLECASGRCD